MEINEIKSKLGRLGIKPSKRFSQNFLISENIARRQVEAAGIQDGDRVLEIGPGLGVLSKHILDKTKNVQFIEKDPHLAGFIREEYSADVISGDAMEEDLSGFDVVIANLPYHISSEITVRLLEAGFRTAILMFQKEFAVHLTASPGSRDYSRITVFREFYSDAEIIMEVPKSNYYPVPKVDSCIVKLEGHEPPFQPRDIDQFFKIVRILFSHKKRTVRNALVSETGVLGTTKEELKPLLTDLPFADERAFNLPPEKIYEISEYVYKILKE